MRFNHTDAQRARVMVRKGLPQNVITDFFGGKYSWEEIEQLVETLRAKAKAFNQANYSGFAHEVRAEQPPPPEVIARRDHRVMLRPRTITALICGDPLPGESALDRVLSTVA